MRKCVYCNADLPDDRSMEICDRCGVGVWGQKMWLAIKKATDNARDNGDLALYKEQEEKNLRKEIAERKAA